MRDPLAGTTREVGWSHRAGWSVVRARPLCHKPIGLRSAWRAGRSQS